jgi:ATP-dependent RNA helicase RhlE
MSKEASERSSDTEALSFEGLGIHPKFLTMISRAGFSVPTPIQQQSIPVTIKGQDVLGIAQTGTGKTLAFGVPMVQRLVETGGMGLVILPTRELAVQVEQSLHRIGRELGIRTALLIGGEGMGKQLRQLSPKPHIVIATPGRLIDHLEQKSVQLDTVKVLVLDEADRMLDMGFAPQLKRILQSVPTERQTLLFSATMPDEIVSIAKQFMKMPIRVEVARQGTTASTVSQEVIFVPKNDKPTVLKELLAEESGGVLIFTRTKFGAKKVAKLVRDLGHSSTELHSNRTLSQRLSSLQGFKAGKFRVLVATDIAARGIDAAGIALVINYDLPAQAEDYVHRIGRTGRAGRSGKAISLASPDQRRDVKDIERLIGQMLPVKHVSGTGPRVQMESIPEPRAFSPRAPRRTNPFSTRPSSGTGPFGRSSRPGPGGRGRPSFKPRFPAAIPSGSSRGGRPRSGR